MLIGVVAAPIKLREVRASRRFPRALRPSRSGPSASLARRSCLRRKIHDGLENASMEGLEKVFGPQPARMRPGIGIGEKASQDALLDFDVVRGKRRSVPPHRMPYASRFMCRISGP